MRSTESNFSVFLEKSILRVVMLKLCLKVEMVKCRVLKFGQSLELIDEISDKAKGFNQWDVRLVFLSQLWKKQSPPFWSLWSLV